MMEIEYDPLLAAVAVVVAVMGSWTALVQVRKAGEAHASLALSVVWCLNAAAVMGGSVWAMHFSSMLSLAFPVPVSYSFTETVASLVLVVAVSGFGLLAATQRSFGPFSLPAGGMLIGLGIIGMHYLGVSAIRGCGVSFDAYSVFASALITMAAATAGLWLALKSRAPGAPLLAGLVIGATIVWVHYSGMYATAFFTDRELVAVPRVQIAQCILAYAIAMAAIAVSAAQLLMATGGPRRPGQPASRQLT